MIEWYPQACPVCGGDIHEDIEDDRRLSCVLCARSFDATGVFSLVAVAWRARLGQAEISVAA